jgi:hypothetical protein
MPRLVATIAAALVLLACSGGTKHAASTSTTEAPNPFAPAGTSDSAKSSAGIARGSFSIGQCFNLARYSGGTPISPADVQVLPCETPHQYEIYEASNYPAGRGDPYPGDEVIDSHTDDRCIAAFEPYVGKPYQQSVFDYETVRPTRASWSDGDRQIACALHDTDFALIGGTAKGVAK